MPSHTLSQISLVSLCPLFAWLRQLHMSHLQFKWYYKDKELLINASNNGFIQDQIEAGIAY